jgi:hypothetical protein
LTGLIEHYGYFGLPLVVGLESFGIPAALTHGTGLG